MSTKILKQFISISLILVLNFYSPFSRFVALSQEAPPPPPSAPTPPPEPSAAPTAPPAPVAPSLSDPTPTPTPVDEVQAQSTDSSSNTSGSSASHDPESDAPDIGNTGNGSGSDNNTSADTTSTSTTTQTNTADVTNNLSGESITGENSADANVGSTTLQTGDSSLVALVQTDTNQNSISQSPSSGGSTPISVGNAGNGTGSTNDTSLTTNTTNTDTQTNDATVANNTYLSSVSGDNSASDNVGDTAIISGDANLGATVITSSNTNLDGVELAEFNVNDNYTGDIILAFSDPSCGGTTVCGASLGSVGNTGNGSDSVNDASLDSTTTDTTTQTNTADLTNNLVFEANSGENLAEDNTGGDTSITTGDANIAANVFSLLNNNFVGTGTPVLLAVVNIFGDLVGDIIMPDVDSMTVANTGNGSGSENSTSVDQTTTNTTTQTNLANIDNNISVDANTGNNETDDNTYEFGQGSSVETGDVSIDANLVNIANQNVSGDTWWVVLVNNAGQWFGQILGADPNSNFAGSAGTEFVLDEEGNVVAIGNTGNGSDTTNNTSVSTTTTNTTTQSNTANLTNNISVNANTGKNSTTGNTGGTNSIATGDVNVLLNVYNFVNNNFVGGKFVFTVVNVFGSWVGNVVTPGSQKVTPPTAAVGGPEPSSSGENSSAENTTLAPASGVQLPPAQTTTGLLARRFKGVLGAVTGSDSSQSETNLTPRVFEDNTIQLLSANPDDINLGSRLDIRWLYAALTLSILIYLLRRPALLKRIGIFLGLL